MLICHSPKKTIKTNEKNLSKEGNRLNVVIIRTITMKDKMSKSKVDKIKVDKIKVDKISDREHSCPNSRQTGFAALFSFAPSSALSYLSLLLLLLLLCPGGQKTL